MSVFSFLVAIRPVVYRKVIKSIYVDLSQIRFNLRRILLLASLIIPAAEDGGLMLQAFGNANMDDWIDESDLDCVEGIVNNE